MTDVERLIGTYPRERPPLSDAAKTIYETEYTLNRTGGRSVEGLAKKLESWMHRKVATVGGDPILELGAGTLNHIKYESPAGRYDVVEPFASLYRGRPEAAKVNKFYPSQKDIPEQQRYARIVSVAVLEHMADLPRELAQSSLRLEDNGVFQAGIPSEGGFLWWLGWRCTTGVSYWLRNRHDYGIVMRHEHLNKASEIVALVRYFFADVSINRFPIAHSHLSFYAYIEARQPRRDRAERLIATGR
jgi:hypothetical protein